MGRSRSPLHLLHRVAHDSRQVKRACRFNVCSVPFSVDHLETRNVRLAATAVICRDADDRPQTAPKQSFGAGSCYFAPRRHQTQIKHRQAEAVTATKVVVDRGTIPAPKSGSMELEAKNSVSASKTTAWERYERLVASLIADQLSTASRQTRRFGASSVDGAGR